MVFGDTGEPAPKVAVQAAKGLVNTLDNDRRPGSRHLEAPTGKISDGELGRPAGLPISSPMANSWWGRALRSKPSCTRCARPASSKSRSWTRRPAQASLTSTCGSRADPNGRRERLVFRSWEVATRIAWRESPRTDARGKLRALVEPGTHRIGVGLESYPRSHEVVEASGQEVECRSGETVQLKFTMRKRPAGAVEDNTIPEPVDHETPGELLVPARP